MVPSYISRSVAGSYDNEGVAIFALVNVFYWFVKVWACVWGVFVCVVGVYVCGRACGGGCWGVCVWGGGRLC